MSRIGVVLHRGSWVRGDAEGCLVFNRALTLDQFEYINTHLLHQGGTMFYVYVEGGNAPKHAHGTKAQAEAEAQRLADVTGKPAHVLRVANAGETASLILFQYAGQVEAQAFVSLAAPIQPDPWFRYRRRYFVIADGDAVEPTSVAGSATTFYEAYDIATRRADWTGRAQRIFYTGSDRNCAPRPASLDGRPRERRDQPTPRDVWAAFRGRTIALPAGKTLHPDNVILMPEAAHSRRVEQAQHLADVRREPVTLFYVTMSPSMSAPMTDVPSTHSTFRTYHPADSNSLTDVVRRVESRNMSNQVGDDNRRLLRVMRAADAWAAETKDFADKMLHPKLRALRNAVEGTPEA